MQSSSYVRIILKCQKSDVVNVGKQNNKILKSQKADAVNGGQQRESNTT